MSGLHPIAAWNTRAVPAGSGEGEQAGGASTRDRDELRGETGKSTALSSAGLPPAASPVSPSVAGEMYTKERVAAWLLATEDGRHLRGMIHKEVEPTIHNAALEEARLRGSGACCPTCRQPCLREAGFCSNPIHALFRGELRAAPWSLERGNR